MDVDTAVQRVRAHFSHATKIHPEAKTANQWHPLVKDRVEDLFEAAAATAKSDHKLVAGKRALQVAAMMLRIIDDLDLQTVGPDYDAGELKHVE